MFSRATNLNYLQTAPTNDKRTLTSCIIQNQYASVSELSWPKLSVSQLASSRYSVFRRSRIKNKMGNTQTKRHEDTSGRRRRPNSIAVDKPIESLSTETSGKRELLRRTASQNSFRRRYTESGNYAYKTPWPAPMSEVVFWPEYESKPPVRFTDFEVGHISCKALISRKQTHTH